MNNKVRKTYIAVWVVFLPVTVLLIMIFILLYNFSITSEKAARSVVEDDLLVETQNFALQIHEELDIMTRMGIAFRDMFANMQYMNQREQLKVIGALCNNSNAYMVVYCDTKGIGFTHNGIKVNVKKDDLLLKQDVDKQYYAYLQKESIMQAEAVVSVIPIMKNENIDGYILMYYSVSHIRKLFTKLIPYDDTFMLYSVDDGLIITTEGLKNEPPSDTMLIKWFQQLDDTFDYDRIREAALNKKEFSFSLTMDKGSKFVIGIPVGISDWYVTVGYEKDLYEQKLTNEWIDIKKLIQYLLVLIFIFLFFMLGTMAIIYLVYNKHNRKLQVAAKTDLLTKLYNKITTEDKIKEYIEDKSNLGGILFILDVDNFKEINDSKGHSAGDEVLKKLGSYLKESLKGHNIMGRVGGDEFFVFITDIKTKEEQEMQTKRVYEIFRGFANSGGIAESVTFSVGCAWYPKDAQDFETLFKAADQALYEAKEKGKDQLVRYQRK
ncbi:MAG: GGDEF domain-containing protein [Candidatus Galacturonibacter soehngenii]|nr:GGDEF domain-containing protein [Candidatus Galacturonibacter soehngenii]